METSSPFVITISRQLGSGGAYIGQQIAKKLNILYIDREIICKAAKELSLTEEELEILDEKPISFMRLALQLCQFGVPDTYIPPQIYMPSDLELFKVESKIIEHISQEYPSVIIGRCGSYILKGKPNHISIFLHADMEFRKKRVQELYRVTNDEAEKMIKKSDSERQRYCMKLSREEWTDAKNYDLTIDTSKIDFDGCLDLIMRYIEFK